jgi:glutamate/tyrosine decarboxylase-like PLP-dependent enzyme
MKVGNAGGGKGPDFWCAFEQGEVKVIGDEPANTDYDPGLQRKLYREAKKGLTPRDDACGPVILSVCLTVKPVGEPDAGNPHVRFDERGWETQCCRMAQATAPILDSTITAARQTQHNVPSWRKLT